MARNQRSSAPNFHDQHQASQDDLHAGANWRAELAELRSDGLVCPAFNGVELPVITAFVSVFVVLFISAAMLAF